MPKNNAMCCSKRLSKIHLYELFVYGCSECNLVYSYAGQEQKLGSYVATHSKSIELIFNKHDGAQMHHVEGLTLQLVEDMQEKSVNKSLAWYENLNIFASLRSVFK